MTNQTKPRPHPYESFYRAKAAQQLYDALVEAEDRMCRACIPYDDPAIQKAREAIAAADTRRGES